MSRKTITKELEAIVCDFCDLEVEVSGDDYCYANIRANGSPVRDASRTPTIKHFIFSWLKIPTEKEKWLKPNAKNKWVRYDFHGACFEAAMVKMLAAKETTNE